MNGTVGISGGTCSMNCVLVCIFALLFEKSGAAVNGTHVIYSSMNCVLV